jgi:gamma-tubulin complex component 3
VLYIIDHIGPALSESAALLQQYTLTSTLEAAVRTVCSDHELEYARHLDVSHIDSHPGDTGWDVFTLNYKVNAPISTIFSTDAMLKYHQMFRFLWKLKRVHYDFSGIWRNHVVSSRRLKRRSNYAAIFHTSHIILSEMLHFAYQLEYYVQFEVLECSWSDFLATTKKEALDLDQLIHEHDLYLKELVQKSMLDNRELRTCLEKLFDALLTFSKLQRQLYRQAQQDDETRVKLLKHAEDYGNQGMWGFDDDHVEEQEELDKKQAEFIAEYQKKLATVQAEYKHSLGQLTGKLAHQSDALRSLSVRLDYNAYYELK